MELIGLYLLIYLLGFSSGFRVGKFTGYVSSINDIQKVCKAAVQLDKKLSLVGRSIKDLSEQELNKKLAEIIEEPKEPDLY